MPVGKSLALALKMCLCEVGEEGAECFHLFCERHSSCPCTVLQSLPIVHSTMRPFRFIAFHSKLDT